MRISGIANDSIVDGPGVRTVIFTQGCRHRCPGCHNPETWSFDGGPEYSLPELLAYLEKNCYTKKVTLSGGDPVYQEELPELCRLLKERDYHIIVYTGFTWDQISDMDFLRYIDLLVDGPFVESLQTLDRPFVGSSNQRIIDVRRSLSEGVPVLLP
ncbi:MAG: anaerobic ribonucleoside-triphosphate reductase activating protein [Abditibacteriota bacterium]|nr:anaerobic ribonucleoside-triphosphate reductase activating protein [Abditibacteriota bacterium]